MKFKKILKIFLISTFLIILTSCKIDKKISLPNPENINKIEISKNNSKDIKFIDDKSQIEKIIKALSTNSKKTKLESVNDHPTNIEDYLILNFYHKSEHSNASRAYLYRDHDKVYIEQPYEGIWILNKKEFSEIEKLISV